MRAKKGAEHIPARDPEIITTLPLERELEILLGAPQLVAKVVGIQKEKGYTINMDAVPITAIVGADTPKRRKVFTLNHFEDGGGIIIEKSRESLRFWQLTAHNYLLVSEKLQEYKKKRKRGVNVSKPSTYIQPRGLLRSFSKKGGEDRKNGNLFLQEIDGNGDIILGRIPETAYKIALTFLTYHQDPTKEKNEKGYVKLPSKVSVCKDADLSQTNHTFFMNWLRVIDCIQVPIIDKVEKPPGYEYERYKLCQVRYVLRDKNTGIITKDEPYTNIRTGETNIDEIWVKVDARILHEIADPPEGFGYVRLPDDYVYHLSALSFIGRKLSAYIFSNTKDHQKRQDNLSEDLGLTDAVKKRGKTAIRNKIIAAFNELRDAGQILEWKIRPGVGGVDVYEWTRIDYGKKDEKGPSSAGNIDYMRG